MSAWRPAADGTAQRGCEPRAMLASVFLVFTGESIARVFFITAGTFAAMSFYGYTTQRDLSQFGSFLIMGLIGIVIASLVNIFIAFSALQFAISVIGGVVFVGLTAWDTQQIKEMYVDDLCRRPGCGQDGGHGRAQTVSRLHQPVHDAAAAFGSAAQRLLSAAGQLQPYRGTKRNHLNGLALDRQQNDRALLRLRVLLAVAARRSLTTPPATAAM
jgi:hypothetical protein